ncbi:ATP-dependent helicase HrpB [Kineobactrum sediminis]|uniref:ATP-dependent helicase HrpB n=1 Tax=Kineobactrum sediminis TaxID=1905677 RepID=A0A2N5Y4V2_9GAMM|nr:ATP-dependent helicase HrpB [Kineobactrum sediminis]PLW83420.1 ATP-dependent helicase HrpB [Kineobactrum sediminis]
MLPPHLSEFPVTDVLPSLRTALAAGRDAVLEAPPGAGKTTVVPLALLAEEWLAGQLILLVQPRRVAARAAAARMASLLGEETGDRVGYRIRLETRVGPATRIEVITEGILTRRLQRDPSLAGVGLVIFDEFHERNLDSELGLALCLQGRELFREGPPLRLLVMSATLSGVPVAGLLDDPAVLTSQGRQFPVTVSHGASLAIGDSVVEPAAQAVRDALAGGEGSILVFLPGQGEIQRLARLLARQPLPDTVVAPLYGGLPLQRQQQAIEPCAPGQRKIVLATNIAETSLTIEGITTVIDSGLERQALFDSSTGTTRLATRRISRASAEQRAGRAGRLGPGHCHRLWSEEQQQRLAAQRTPEILQSDLAPLVLQLLAWGVYDPTELRWLDPPPAANYRQGLEVLALGEAAFARDDGRWQLTPHGVRLSQLPLHPRLGHMLLLACDLGATEAAALLAAALAERNPLADAGAELATTLAVLQGTQPCPKELQGWQRRCRQQARRYQQIVAQIYQPTAPVLSVPAEDLPAVLLASAWPDRIARRRSGGEADEFQLANGRSATLPAGDPLATAEWLAVGEVGGQRGSSADRIYSASQLNPARFSDVLAPLVTRTERAEWDDSADQFVAQSRQQVGRLTLASQTLQQLPEEALAAALGSLLRRRGLQLLPWTPALEQWRARVALLRRLDPDNTARPWPDLGDAALLASLEQWLLPWLGQVRKLQDFARVDLRQLLLNLLPWPLPLDLEQLAPERLVVPSGSSVAIDYLPDTPVLAVKLQEMFGCADTPRIANGRQLLQLHLLSPAQRPLQVTQDLATFWRNVYPEVKKEMRGRYPKHPWPDDPLKALPTRHVKRRVSGA